MKIIHLQRGYSATVDDADYDIVNRYHWHADVYPNDVVYARSNTVINGKKTTVLMHRIIMGNGAKDFPLIDHKDRNGLNNTRRNLRWADRSGNLANTPSRPGSSSKYKGVTWDKNKEQMARPGKESEYW